IVTGTQTVCQHTMRRSNHACVRSSPGCGATNHAAVVLAGARWQPARLAISDGCSGALYGIGAPSGSSPCSRGS
ncbi:MAG: hypothetical protein ABW178_12535, partial [Pseudoxanthomonas sp.]